MSDTWKVGPAISLLAAEERSECYTNAQSSKCSKENLLNYTAIFNIVMRSFLINDEDLEC